MAWKRALVMVLVLAAALPTAAGTSGAALALPTPVDGQPTIHRLAGGPTDGPALATGMTPRDVAFVDGDLVITDVLIESIRRLDLATGHQQVLASVVTDGPDRDEGPADAVPVRPGSVAAAANGDLYFTTEHGSSVTRLTADGWISPFAHTDYEERQWVDGVDVAPDGRVLLAATTIVAAAAPDGTLTTLAGGGTLTGAAAHGAPALSVALDRVEDVVGSPDGSIYVADSGAVGGSGAGSVRRIAPDGRIWTVLGGLGAPTSVELDDEGRLYVGDAYRRTVIRRDPDGTTRVVAGGGQSTDRSGAGVSATATQLGPPWGLAYDPVTDRLAIADRGSVWLLAPDGTMRSVAGEVGVDASEGRPSADVQLYHPRDVAAGPDGSVYLSELHRVRRISPDGTIRVFAGTGWTGDDGEGGLATAADLGQIQSIAMDRTGALLIAHQGSGVVGGLIRRVGSDGIIRTIAGGGEHHADVVRATDAKLDGYATGLAVGADGSVYFTEGQFHRVRRLIPDGTLVTVAGTGTQGFDERGGRFALDTSLARPQNLAVDDAGNVFYTTDHALMMVTPNGVVVRYLHDEGATFRPQPGIWAGAGSAADLLVDRNGNLLVSFGGGISRVLRDGRIEQVAGGSQPTTYGDGGPAASAHMNANSIAERPDGSIVILEQPTHRVREIRDVPGAVSAPASLLPAPPRAIDAVAGNGFVTVSWLYPLWQGGASTFEYVVDALVDGEVIASRTVQWWPAQVSLDGLTNGVEHEVRVRVRNNAGLGAPAITHATPTTAGADRTPASAPKLDTYGFEGNGYASVRWSAPASDGGSPVSAYSIVAIDTAANRLAGWVNVGPDERQASVPRLQNGRSYDLHVFAWTGVGMGAASTKAGVVPRASLLPASVPARPTQLVVLPAPDGRIDVSWLSGFSDGGSPVLGHLVVVLQRGAVVGFAFVPPMQRHVQLGPVEPDIPFSVHVVPYNAVGAATSWQTATPTFRSA